MTFEQAKAFVKKHKVEFILGGLVGAGLILVGIDAHRTKKINRMLKKFNVCLKDLEEKSDVEIQESILNAVTKKVAEKKAREIATDAAIKCKEDIERDVHDQVWKTVNAAYPDIRRCIYSKLNSVLDSFGDRQYQEIREEVIDAITNSFEDKLDDVIDELSKKGEEKLDDVIDNVADHFDTVRTVFDRAYKVNYKS